MPRPDNIDISEEQQQFLLRKTEFGFRFVKWKHIFVGETGGGGHYWWTSYHLSPEQRDNPPESALRHPTAPFSFKGRNFFPLKFTMTEITLYIFLAARLQSTNERLQQLTGWAEGFGIHVFLNGKNITSAFPVSVKKGRPLPMALASEATAHASAAIPGTSAAAEMAEEKSHADSAPVVSGKP